MDLGEPIAIGNTAKIYLYENKIIKLFNDYLPETESSYEATKQHVAYTSGLPVPKVIDVTKIEEKQVIIMEYMEGRTLGELLSEKKELAEHYLRISIDVQRKIHQVVADSLEPMSEKLRRQIEAAPLLNDKRRTKLLQLLGSMKFENRLCHGDFHLFNLIMTDQQVKIIDWVDASAGDLRADVYRTYLLYSQYSSDLADMYIQLYCEKSGLKQEEIFQWAPIIAAARLSENVSTEDSNRLLAIINRYVS
ncbi:Phosphotransferase enzyme family protein [Oceanobacillus limi]|uniref:Phosphotransferase enzyme family protein n=1 Tax=Oceanobacillus limi TaxID=930131 RepID=A0A1I0GMN1_9BACI|nr:aminoglycoside phosphotransferase family protein [Oceanobacillus limi]SET71657.1 Phosphotransferase enzyme family protein [Oceanobacillus limi]